VKALVHMVSQLLINNKKVDNIKINSNPNTKSGKTRIGKLAGGLRGGIGGGGMNWQTK
jgi:hypothetical protein